MTLLICRVPFSIRKFCYALVPLLATLLFYIQTSHAEDLSEKTPKAASFNNFYLVTWDTKSITNRKKFDKLLSDQAGSLLKLWKAGKIENVYIDPKPTDQEGQRVGTVAFFVRATSPEAAKGILADMPFVKNKVASYQLKEVGAFWLGRPEDLGIGTND